MRSPKRKNRIFHSIAREPRLKDVTQELDATLNAWRNRSLKYFSSVFIETINDEILIAIGIKTNSYPSAIGICVKTMNPDKFLLSLKERGMSARNITVNGNPDFLENLKLKIKNQTQIPELLFTEEHLERITTSILIEQDEAWITTIDPQEQTHEST